MNLRSRLSLLCSTALLAASLPALAGTKPADDPKWTAFLNDYQEGFFAAEPAQAVYAGRHEYDGKLPDWSAAGLAKEADWFKSERKQALAFKPSSLPPQQRFEREYLLARIDGELFWREEAQAPFHNPAFYLDNGFDPSVYMERPYKPLDQRLKAFVGYLHSIPAAAGQIRANLKTPLPKTFVKRGISAFGGYADFFRNDAPKAYAEVKDPALQDELKAAIGPAAQAMQELAEWFKAQQAAADDSFVLGPRRFADMLWRTERVRTPLAELERVGKADLARNTAALKEACAQLLPGGTLEACVAKVEADKPQGSVVEAARAQLTQLRQFVQDKNLVGIPGTEQALVNEAPPYQRWNFAYINIAGPYDKGMPSTYYVSPPDPSWPKAEQEAYEPGKAMLLFTSAHEVWPGHFLQFLHANRSSSTFGQIFVGYAFAEGWAHYSEEMMWEAGLGDGAPDVHVGQLSEALLRDVRFLCAIGMHTQGMKVETCQKMFREQGYQDAGNATQQAERGTFDPAYLNYTLGKLMIRKLRADWTGSRGGRDAWHDFHDQFLSYGGPPIPLVREQMMGPKDKGKLF
ncbi:MAG TPA: DUF885 domain-containing protein [Nevskia sp.]|nr:DUF885 domain-containing protein [Nevskia sp.]